MEVFLIFIISSVAIAFCIYTISTLSASSHDQQPNRDFNCQKSNQSSQSYSSNATSRAYEFYHSGRNNFEIIACNMAMYYYTIKHSSIGNKIDDMCAQYLAASYVVSLYPSISQEEVFKAMLFAELDSVSLGDEVIPYIPLSCENRNLVRLCMQVEVLIFREDHPSISSSDILHSVIVAQEFVARGVNNVMTRGSTHALYSLFKMIVDSHLNDPDILKTAFMVNSLFQEDEGDTVRY